MTQKLILAAQMTELLANGVEAARSGDGSRFYPMVKLFTPDANATWLITEIAEDGDTLFGLCDLGHGSPELGYVSLAEITALRGRMRLPVERDRHFQPRGTIAEYAAAARAAGRIVQIGSD